MYAVHRLTVVRRVALQPFLDDISRRMHRLNRDVLTDLSTSAEERGQMLAGIDSLKELYERERKAPTWPFECSMALKFVSLKS